MKIRECKKHQCRACSEADKTQLSIKIKKKKITKNIKLNVQSERMID